ncbi:hypothetical protein QTO34_008680 [Cnephaeus nilssonii]|uniref:Brain-specific angiogenesis inhibitor 1-associated protein 2 n=1 Tax=Cnephaeus nilssonii TaxID=3371016 RepID=A0AA40HGE7_CNENI|nr:hypothetical protein QTO34_008680 [Eptesicus nilssonii]
MDIRAVASGRGWPDTRSGHTRQNPGHRVGVGRGAGQAAVCAPGLGVPTRESRTSCPGLRGPALSPQYIDAISSKQGDLENYVSDGYKTALTEERRRFCFLVEKQCAVAKNSATYHSKGKELLAQKLPLWQQACADPNKIPDRAVQLLQQLASSNGAVLPGALSASKSSLVISDPIPGAKPLPVPPELAPFVGRLSAQENAPIMNGVSGPDSEDYSPWADRKGAQPKSSSSSQPQTKMSDSYSNTLPVRKSVAPKNSYATTENKTLPRSSSMAAGLERNGRTRVKAIFSHAAGDNSTLLSFKEGDLITLLVPEARDGWHYGESEKTKMRGWFPFSYTRVLDSDGGDRVHARAEPGVGRWGQARPQAGTSLSTVRARSLQPGKSSSTGNLLDKDDLALPPPDYGPSSRGFPTQTASTFKQRPYSMAVPAFSQGLDDYGARAVSRGRHLRSQHAAPARGQHHRSSRAQGGTERPEWGGGLVGAPGTEVSRAEAVGGPSGRGSPGRSCSEDTSPPGSTGAPLLLAPGILDSARHARRPAARTPSCGLGMRVTGLPPRWEVVSLGAVCVRLVSVRPLSVGPSQATLGPGCMAGRVGCWAVCVCLQVGRLRPRGPVGAICPRRPGSRPPTLTPSSPPQEPLCQCPAEADSDRRQVCPPPQLTPRTGRRARPAPWEPCSQVPGRLQRLPHASPGPAAPVTGRL